MLSEMKILCDTNLPLGRTLFSTLGEVMLIDGTRLSARDLRDADMLMVRNTPLNARLLEGSPVRFIGSAVSGTDHVDADWLEQAGITWVNAPGANSESVAEYCLAALLEYAHMRHRKLEGATAAILGAGWIGSLVGRRCAALGMRVLLCDPPRQAHPRDVEAQRFVPLAEALREADYIIPFVPLTRGGAHPTWHLLNRETLAGIRHGAVLINMSRGAICDTTAVIEALQEGRLRDGIFDVWEGEPNFSPELAALAFLSTPHLAGSAYEGKINGTLAIYRAACAFLGLRPAMRPTLPPPIVPRIEVDAAGKPEEEVLWFITQKLSMIVADHLNFQELIGLPQAARVRRFLALRRAYTYRRQFNSTTLVLRRGSQRLAEKIAALGFTLELA